jgi:hypothetical protein
VDYVTAIFGHLVEPIFQLYQKLIGRHRSKPNEVQTSLIENGYAISIVTLSAFLIESVCGRAGDPKFRRVVDMKTRTTRRLGLDVFPTRIHRHTAVVSLKQAVRVLRFFEGLDRNIAYLSPTHVFVNGKATLFFKWVDSLKP